MVERNRTRWSGLLFLLAGIGCERPIPPGFEPVEIVGYRVEGFVKDGFGAPMRNVSVTVEYDPDYVNGGPPPAREYEVTVPNQSVRVRVYDGTGRPIRTLYSGSPAVGSLPMVWDERNGSGQLVASGLYWVHCEVNNVSEYSYPVIVDETVTAVTDSAGFFVLPDYNLPLGFYPYAVYADDGSTFWGNYRVGERVFLLFSAAGITTSRTIMPERNRLTTVIVTFN